MHSLASTPVHADELEHTAPTAGPSDEAPTTAVMPSRPWPLPVQRSMRVGDAHDPTELEADRTADQVLDILRGDEPAVEPGVEPHHTGAASPAGLSRLRRVSRTARMGAAGGALDLATEGQIDRLRGGGSPMPGSVRARMEPAFGANLSQVRVHTGGEATALSNRLGAQAFTVGSDVVFAGGMPDVQRESGQRLWAHELTHVLQQRGGGELGRLRRKASEPSEPRPAPTVRRISTLAAFKTATPATLLNARKRITTVDDRLSDYIESTGAARLVALNALILACTTYIGAGGQAAGRVAAVTNLRAEAQAEVPLLTALGAANADLLEDIVLRAGGAAANLPALTQLATHITAAQASLLPRLILDVGGAAGIADLDALVQAVNPIAQVVNLSTLIGMSPGQLNHLAPLLAAAAGNVADLVFLVPRAGGGNMATLNALTGLLGPAVGVTALLSHGGNTARLMAMAVLANGNQATFVRVATEARHFRGLNPPPGQAGGLHLNQPRNVFDAAAPGPDPGAGYSNAQYTVRWGHFYERHVREYFDLNDIKPRNAFWPVGWNNALMKAVVDLWLDAAAVAGVYLGGPNPATDRAAPAAFTATVASPGGNVQVRGGVYDQPVVPAPPFGPAPLVPRSWSRPRRKSRSSSR